MSSSKQLKAVDFKAGVHRNTTEYNSEGFWVESEKIRFRNSRVEKQGGFVSEGLTDSVTGLSTTFDGTPRKMMAWNNLSGINFLLSTSEKKLEIVRSNVKYDVTPLRITPSLTDPITTVDTESEVTITHTSHGLNLNDIINVTSQAAAVNGITLEGEYVVIEVVDGDNYIIDSGTVATGSTSGDGGAVEIDYLIGVGSTDNGGLTGWSGGSWGTLGAGGGGWGRPRVSTTGRSLRLWSTATWGEDALACQRNGGLYHWDATNGENTRFQVLANSPSQNLFMLVSQPSRHLIAFGSEVAATEVFDPLIIRWAEQETLTGWDIESTNSAGEYRLASGNFIVGAVQTRSEILVFTDTDVYSMRYIGGNDVFQFTPLGTNVSAISQNSIIDINGIVYWVGYDSIYMYDGVVKELPMSLSRYLFDQDGDGRINQAQKEKTFVAVNKEFNEIFIFYPRYDSNEVSHYVKYNYAEGVSDYGTYNRTAWIDRGVFNRPYATTSAGKLFIQEEGKDADGAPLLAYIRSSYFDIGDGQEMVFIDRLIPDLTLPTNRNISVTIFYKRYPQPQAQSYSKGPFFVDDSVEKVSCRVRGRQFSIEYRSNASGSDFALGKTRLSMQLDGGR